jgi:hypothetical protein
MSTITGEEYLSSGQYFLDLNTIKSLATQISTTATAMLPGGIVFTSDYEQILDLSVKETLIAKAADINAYCDQVRARGDLMAGFLTATKEV